MKILDALGKSKKAIGGLIAIVLLVVVIFFAGVLFGGRNNDDSITSTGLTQTLKTIDEMAVMEYNYTKVGKFTNSLKLNGWSIPLTEKSFLLTYSGKLKAGIDMSQIKVSVSGKTITVTTPAVKVLSNEIDESSIEVYDEGQNIFNPISVSDYTTFATRQKAKVELEALKNGLLTQAKQKVISTIKNHLNMINSIRKSYTIKVNVNG